MSLEKRTFQTVDEIADEIRLRLRARGRQSGPVQSGGTTAEPLLIAIGELDDSTNYAFVESLYRRVWKQEPDAGGIQRFVCQLDAGQKTRAQIAAEFHDAPRARLLGTGIVEFLSAAESSKGARRPASVSVPAIDRGRRWYRYEEFLAYSGLSFVTHVFRALLKREPDENGLSRCLHAIESGAVSKLEVIRNLSQSDEARLTGTRVWNLDARQPTPGVSPSRASVGAPPVNQQKTTYSLQELVEVPDQIFLQNLYRCLLKREPDSSGGKTYNSLWLSGSASSADIVYAVATSPEAGAQGVMVTGLRLTGFRRTLASLPLVGFVFEIGTWLLHLPQLGRNFRQVYHHNRILLEQLQRETAADRERTQNRTLDLSLETAALFAQAERAAVDQDEIRTVQESLRSSVETMRLLVSALEGSKADLEDVQRALEGKANNAALAALSASKADREELRRSLEQIERQAALLRKLDKAEMERLSAGKADRDETVAALSTKVERQIVERLQQQKADRQEVFTALSFKADRKLVEDVDSRKAGREEVLGLLAAKADSAQFDELSKDKADRKFAEDLYHQKADREEVLGLLAAKADNAQVSELAEQKADRKFTENLYHQKADREEVLGLLAAKADNAQVSELAEQKADRKFTENLYHQKADREEVLGLLAAKADNAQVSELAEQKADCKFTEDLYHQKADREEVLGLLTAKADRAQFDELSTQKADRKFAEDLYHQKADQAVVAALTEQQQSSLAALHAQKLRILNMERRLSLLLEEARKRFPAPIQQDQADAIVLAGKGVLDAMYTEFEDIFRGTREDIKSRQAVYFPRILKNAPEHRKRALDVGCGRGEFLELLVEQGFTTKGVDMNEAMVTRCRDLGLDVEHADGIEYLKSQKANSHSLISAFHVVEHLPHQRLVTLLDEALRTLAPGGILILETPNPRNLLVGSCNFYLDPTHLNPVPHQLLQFLVEARGFVNPEVIPLHPVPDYARPQPALSPDYMNELLFGPQDYGVVAWKA